MVCIIISFVQGKNRWTLGEIEMITWIPILSSRRQGGVAYGLFSSSRIFFPNFRVACRFRIISGSHRCYPADMVRFRCNSSGD